MSDPMNTVCGVPVPSKDSMSARIITLATTVILSSGLAIYVAGSFADDRAREVVKSHAHAPAHDGAEKRLDEVEKKQVEHNSELKHIKESIDDIKDELKESNKKLDIIIQQRI